MRALLVALLLALAVPASGQADPNGHRLLFAPTAQPVRAGGVTLGLASLVVPNATVGVGRGLTLGVGAVALREGWGTVFAEPKWTVYAGDRLAVAVGASAQFDVQSGEVHALPYVVATATRGRTDVTAGLGGRLDYADRFVGPFPEPCVTCLSIVPAVERDLTLTPAPAAMLGAQVALGPRVSVLAEAVAYPTRGGTEASATGGLGLRVRHRQAVFDLGAAVVSDGGGERYTYPAPWVNVGVGF